MISTVKQTEVDIAILSISLDNSGEARNLEIVAALICMYFWFCCSIKEMYRSYAFWHRKLWVYSFLYTNAGICGMVVIIPTCADPISSIKDREPRLRPSLLASHCDIKFWYVLPTGRLFWAFPRFESLVVEMGFYITDWIGCHFDSLW